MFGNTAETLHDLPSIHHSIARQAMGLLMADQNVRSSLASINTTIIFAALKLDGHNWFVDWSWTWIVCPVWIPIIIGIVAAIFRFLSLAMRKVWGR